MRSVYVNRRERVSGAAGVDLNVAVGSEGIQVNEVCIVRNLIYVAPFTQVPRERTNVANLHHSFPADISLNAYLEVIDSGSFRINFDGVD